MAKRKTKDEFIAAARKIHGDKYTYTYADYTNNYTPVKIICPKHGVFQMTPNMHTSGRCGCRKCAIEDRTKTTKEFIEKAKEVHGCKYNYDKVDYKGANKWVVITCPKHGDFLSTPSNHTNMKCGCPTCAKEAQRMSKEEFITKAKKAHGNKYCYSMVKIDGNNKTKVMVKCNACGMAFLQQIDAHLSGQGCPFCAKEAQRITREEFIIRAKEAHGDKYRYDKVEYIRSNIPVIITCSIHGDFTQKPYKHLQGQGCPACSESHLEARTRIILEQNNITFELQKKFPWLKNKGSMCLDFYLPKFNIAIECQGIQHYKTSGIYTEEKVAYTKQNDAIKYSLCQEHGISIYYIMYNDNVENKINEIIDKLNEWQNR